MNEYYHCKTQEQYNWLMDRFDKKGYRWNSGRKPKECGNWYKHNINTVIELSDEKLCMCDTLFYKEEENVTDFIDVGELMRKEDEFNLPKHYDVPNLKQSVIDIMMAFAKFNCEGNIELAWYYTSILERVFRWKHKDGKEDLKKAKFFIDKMLDYLESEGEDD